ncbi:HAMP domain-containing sensor histidine kinase [Pyruvatibacter sp.]|uniref:sensor histidine kinase n=1 Tax=Pyruvatibacter sp. TaxID=1981328 RepID=UPI0032EF45A3
MPRNKLLSTTTFRMAVVYLALFMASASALLGYLYWNTAGFLARQTEATVQAETAALITQLEEGGRAALVHATITKARDPRQNLFLLQDANGEKLGGNLDVWPDQTTGVGGWLNFEYARRTAEGDIEFHEAQAVATDLPDGLRLLVGQDIEERRRLEAQITNALAWAVAAMIVLGLAGGAIISRNVVARIDDINRTAKDIMGGELSRRIPVTGAGDEIDQLAENLNDMLDQIERLMLGMRQVTDNIAHDLRSPLNRLRNRLEVTLMKPATQEQYAEALERSISEADELLGTFNALLLIARAEAGAARDGMDWVDLSALVHDAAELYEPVADEAGLDLTLDIEPNLDYRGHRELLAQMIANLLDNAIKHASGDAGGRTIHMALKARGMLGAEIVVADSGPGIDTDDRERVLGRFVRLEQSRNTPGSGLGLSLVNAVARLHGGDVRLEDNQPGLRAVISLARRARRRPSDLAAE